MQSDYVKFGALALVLMLITGSIGGVITAKMQNGQIAELKATIAEVGQKVGAASAQTDFTKLTDLKIDNDLLVVGDTELQATTTLQEINYGSRFRDALDNTLATTTGSYASLLNTGMEKICTNVTLWTSRQFEGSMVASIATSTAATTFSNGSAAGVIASTTVPTGTPMFLSMAENIGTAALSNFKWPNGTYIIAALNQGTKSNASSSDYSTAAGFMDVECFVP